MLALWQMFKLFIEMQIMTVHSFLNLFKIQTSFAAPGYEMFSIIQFVSIKLL